MRRLPLLLVLAVAGCAEEAVDKTPYPFIVDEGGRALILRGLNVMSSAKAHPLRMPDAGPEDFRRMVEDWGFNHVRYLIFWDALEPQKGLYDSAYLDRIAGKLDELHAAGLSVVLDMHQDVYAARFCCDGAPDWAIRDDGQPFELQDQWFLNYFQPAVRAAFDNFFEVNGDHPDLQQHYRAAWTEVAKRFKDHPAVIGYDLINEPHPGSMIDAGELIGLPSPSSPSPIFDRQRLGPFYQALIDQIRSVDADSYLFFEPRYGAPANGAPSWLPALNDPRRGPPRIVYYPHMYSIKLEGSGRYDPQNDHSLGDWERERRKELEAQTMPMAIGEWGLDRGTEGWSDFVNGTLAMADRMLAGWTYWSYDPGAWGIVDPADGRPETPLAALLVRPYPQAVAGRPTAMHYDPEQREFSLQWDRVEGVVGNTVLFIPLQRHYPDGVDISVDGQPVALGTNWDAQRQLLTVEQGAGAQHHLLLRPRSP